MPRVAAFFAATLGERFKRLMYPERVPSFVSFSNATRLNTTRNTSVIE